MQMPHTGFINLHNLTQKAQNNKKPGNRDFENSEMVSG